MSVIGIDFGNESSFVAVAKAGGIETIANDYSLRATPSHVAFAGKNRILGVAAKNQQVTNMKNTICGFKKLLGRQFNDPHTQNEIRLTPNVVEARPDGGIGFRVNYLGEEHVFSPEQLTAMLFTKLKDTSSAALQTQINDCVITVPFYYTNAERKALLDAAHIAGLNVLRLMNETTATALSYGFYRTDLPDETAKSRYVVFVDCGHSSVQVSACAFNKNKLRMMSATYSEVGGRDFDAFLADYFSKDFISKYGFDPRSNKRAYLRLITEVEKIKKQMSANGTKLPLNIECFMNDVDVTSSIQRSDFEQLCSGLFTKIEEAMKKCLVASKLVLDDIHSVEIVGGSSRIPAIKAIIEKIFGKAPSTTLNQDEAVARGAALQCAIMSPAVRVKEFGVTDIQSYSVNIRYDGGIDGARGEMEVFPANHAAPFSKMLSLNRRDQFNLDIYYADPQNLPYPDTFIGRWSIKGIKAQHANESPEIKIKVRVNNNGIILVSSAQMLEKRENENEGGETQHGGSSEPNSQEPMEVQDDDKASKEDKKKKVTSKLVELALDAETHGFSITDLDNYFEQECKMVRNDCQEKERIDARNALEEFVYDIRGKIQEGGDLYSYATDSVREKMCAELDEVENWLYEDGEDCERQIYKDRLSALHKQTDPIKIRRAEYLEQPQAFEQLGRSIQLARKAVDQYRNGDEHYSHLTETEILNISDAVEKAEKFFSDAKAKLNKGDLTLDPAIKLASIHNENETLQACVRSVLSRPKPKSPTPPVAENNANVDAKNDSDGKSEQHSQEPEDKMDVE